LIFEGNSYQIIINIVTILNNLKISSKIAQMLRGLGIDLECDYTTKLKVLLVAQRTPRSSLVF